MMLSLFGDAIVAVLLVTTISYAAILNRRLGVLRGDRAKLEELVQGLTVAAQRAESGIVALKGATEDVGKRLERRIEQAQGLRDDLAYLVDHGGGVADRLAGTIRARRDDTKPEPPPERRRDPRLETQPRAADAAPVEPRLVPTAHEAAPGPRPAAPSRAERELLRALSSR